MIDPEERDTTWEDWAERQAEIYLMEQVEDLYEEKWEYE